MGTLVNYADYLEHCCLVSSLLTPNFILGEVESFCTARDTTCRRKAFNHAPRMDSHIKDPGCPLYPRGERSVLVPLRVFSLKRFPAGAFEPGTVSLVSSAPLHLHPLFCLFFVLFSFNSRA